MPSRRKLGALTIMTLAGAAAVAAGCHGGSPSRIVERNAGGTTPTSSLRPIGAPGAGGAVVLARAGDRRVALIADEDAKAVITFDVEARRQLAESRVGGSPSQVYVAADGRVFVTVRDANKLLALRFDGADAPLGEAAAVTVPAEPVAIAATPDERTLLVSSGWGRRLTALDATTLASRFEAKLPREPRAIVVSDDGKTAFVSHAVGSVMSAVDLVGPQHATRAISMRSSPTPVKHGLGLVTIPGSARKPNIPPLREHERLVERQSCQGFVLAKSAAVPNRIFAPQVMVDPGDLEKRQVGYGDAATIPEVATVAVLDEAESRPLPPSMDVKHQHGLISSRPSDAGECLLPRAAAIDPKSKTLLVGCFGIDAVIAYDAMSASPAQAVKRHWNVGAGPSGIAVDAERRQAVVFSQFDRTVSILDLDVDGLVDDKSSPPTAEKTPLAPLRDGVSPAFLIGRMLFHASGDLRISADGRACASCHPDGRDDAITWATPEGPRRSIMLAGRVAATPPYSWDGNAPSIAQHLSSTFSRLRGFGLRSWELDALVAYVSALPPPPARAIDDPAKVERGRQIFASKETGCTDCHSGTQLTDGKNHDVDSKHVADSFATFNTPSLRFVGGTGPYFHDGRYATLGELLRKSDGKMGRTAHLSNADLEALQSYLETL